MHNNEITITLVDAHQRVRSFEFDEPRICVFGRAPDCDIAAPEGDENLLISRHHCLLEIDPPTVRVHDLGSTNGTYVNGEKLRRKRRNGQEDSTSNGAQLYDGDEVAAGLVVLRVHTSGRLPPVAFPDFALEFDDAIINEIDGDARTTNNRRLFHS